MRRYLLLSKYGPRAASTRYRYLQYLPSLSAAGVSVVQSPLFGDDYLTAQYRADSTVVPAIKGYVRRFSDFFYSRRFDKVLLNYEALPYLPAWFEQGLSVPYILDLDDAFFLQYQKGWPGKLFPEKIGRVCGSAEAVVAGNSYLADYALRYSSNVYIVPTVVDTEQYRPVSEAAKKAVVGWIGSPSTANYLRPLEETFRKLDASVCIVGAGKTKLNVKNGEFRDWQEDREIRDIQDFSIGVMPLSDDLWARGKCGFKLIQYMACGIPVVASPVGVNQKIVEHGKNGFLARNESEWFEYLNVLLSDEPLRRKMGLEARKSITESYSLERWKDEWVRIHLS